MRVLLAIVLAVAVSSSAFAQGSAEKQAKHKSGTTKMWVGLGLLVIGGSMAATSHESESSSVPGTGIKVEASATSVGQLIVGSAMAGAGAYLLWNGLKERKEADAMPSTRLLITAGSNSIGGFIRRTW